MITRQVVYNGFLLCYHHECDWAFQKARGISWPVAMAHRELRIPEKYKKPASGVLFTYDRQRVDIFSVYRTCGVKLANPHLREDMVNALEGEAQRGAWHIKNAKTGKVEHVEHALVDGQTAHHWLTHDQAWDLRSTVVPRFKKEHAAAIMEYMKPEDDFQRSLID